MSKKTIIILLALIVIALGIFYYLIDNSQPTGPLGGDRDEHGCIGSAGYSWCESKSKCLRVWEEGCPEAAETD